MNVMRKTLLASALIAATGAAQANLSDGKLKIGVLGDMSGVYADISGQGSVEAVKMAVEDFGGKVLGKEIEIVKELTWRWALGAFLVLALAWALSLWWLRGMV